MQKIIISFLSCTLILVSINVFARDKQPNRFDDDKDSTTVQQTSSTPAPARKLSVDERLQRLERLINSQGLVDLLLKLESLQKEIQQLRGDVETQGHIAEDLKKRQRDLYVDIDRRLLQIERNTSGNTKSNTYVERPVSPPVSQTTQTNQVQASSPERQSVPLANNSSTKSVDPIKEQNAYQKAFDLLRELRYDEAIKAYRQFIQDYPNGRYAHIAQYWLSEASYAQRHFKEAIVDYQSLVTNYPASPKLAEAMLKIAYSYYELGQMKNSQENSEKLIRLYPNTTAAGQAQNLLKKIKSAKH